MKKFLVQFLQFLLFLGMGIGILYLVFSHQNNAYINECCIKNLPQWETIHQPAEKEALLQKCRSAPLADTGCRPLTEKLASDFGSAHLGWIGLVLLAFVISNVHRTLKWHMLIRPLGYRPRFINGFLTILVAYFANLGLPRMGELIRAGLFSKYEKIPVEKVMGTIVVDRITDAFCLLLAFFLALALEADKITNYILRSSAGTSMAADSGSLWLLFLLSSLILGTFLFLFRKKILKNPLVQRTLKLVRGFWEGLQTVGRLQNPGLFIFHSLAIWALYFVMTWLGFKSFGPTAHLGLQAALIVFVFGTLGFVIPSPGGMGTFHALVIASLTTFYSIRGDDAFSIANIIFFSVSIGFNVTLGLIALILLPWVNKKLPSFKHFA